MQGGGGQGGRRAKEWREWGGGNKDEYSPWRQPILVKRNGYLSVSSTKHGGCVSKQNAVLKNQLKLFPFVQKTPLRRLCINLTCDSSYGRLNC